MRRFRAKDKRLLIEALRRQPSLGCFEPVIKKLATVARLKSYSPGTPLIIQGADDNRIAFILSGCVDILVKGEKVAQRTSCQHVGEMSVIDPTARRSASVVAAEATSVAWIEEKDFSKIAEAYPRLWRHLACELAERLRQRASLIRDKNPKPIIFIGSSSESWSVARAVAKALSNDPVTVEPWKQGVFGVSDSTIEGLEKMAQKADFAVLVLSADDKLTTRRGKKIAPRDNVVFELGLFMGAIGRSRTFMLRQNHKKLRLPPDVEGVTYLSFGKKKGKPVADDIKKAVNVIRSRISQLNVR